jgi:aspartate racemase
MEASLRRIRDRLYRSARRRYRLAAYSGHVAFFRALGDAAEPLGGEDPSAAWKRVALGDFDTHDVPGSHIGILEPPHVGSLARALLESLERAESESMRVG